MLAPFTKTYLRMKIEKELYDSIFSISDKFGLQGVLYALEESPAVLDEIIQKHKNDVEQNLKKDINYGCVIS